MTKAGLMNSEGWTPKIQRREPLTSAPNISARTISAMLTAKTISAARRMWRGDRNEVATISSAGRRQQQSLAIDEVEGRQAEPLGDRRAGGERHHQADHHQRAERAEQPAVDRTKPIGERAAFGARNHEPLLEFSVCAKCSASRSVPRRARETGRRAFRNWRIGRRRRRPAKAARRARPLRSPAASRAAAATAASSVPQRSKATLPSSVARKFVGRLADQIGLGDPREQGPQAARCRPPSPCRRRSRICR